MNGLHILTMTEKSHLLHSKYIGNVKTVRNALTFSRIYIIIEVNIEHGGQFYAGYIQSENQRVC